MAGPVVSEEGNQLVAPILASLNYWVDPMLVGPILLQHKWCCVERPVHGAAKALIKATIRPEGPVWL